MSKIEELEAQVEQLTRLLEHAGIRLPQQKQEHNSDYIEYGSPQHAALLGLLEVDNAEQAKKDGYTLYVSPKTGKTYRLEDEIGAMQFYPGVDPEKAFLVVLRQKVNSLESGKPKVPDNAPPMFNPGNLTV